METRIKDADFKPRVKTPYFERHTGQEKKPQQEKK